MNGPRILFKNTYIPLLLGALGLVSAASANAQSQCDSFYPKSYTLTQGMLTTGMPSMSRPAKGTKIKEPSFGTCLTRATDHAAEGVTKFSRNYYSRRQAFNANNSYFITFSPDGWHLYDAGSLKHLRKLSPLVAKPSTPVQYNIGGDSEVVWHPTDPNSLYYLSAKGSTKIMKLDVRTNAYSVVADVASSLPSWAAGTTKMWTRWEGSPSKDARYWGFQLEGSGKRLGFITWDLQQNKLVGSMKSSISSDHTSMSPSGRWIVIADTASGTGTWAYSPDFKQKKKLMATSGHSDLAVGANGHDYYVSIDYASSKGDVFMVDLDTCPAVAASASSAAYCPRTVLFQQYINGASSAMHISGKAFDRPGWVVVSSYGTKNSRDGSVPWYANKVFLMEMNAKPRIYPIAYTRRTNASSGDSYWSETHASASRDLTRVIFNSNWGSSSYDDVDTYIVKIPTTAFPGGTVVTPPGSSRVTGGSLRPRSGGNRGMSASALLPTLGAATAIVDTSASDANGSTGATPVPAEDKPAASTVWISPGMRMVRGLAAGVRQLSVPARHNASAIPRVAFLSLPSVAWMRSVMIEKGILE